MKINSKYFWPFIQLCFFLPFASSLPRIYFVGKKQKEAVSAGYNFSVNVYFVKLNRLRHGKTESNTMNCF